MTRQKYHSYQEIIEITSELVNNAINLREIIAEDTDLTDRLDRSAEYVYKVLLDFKYKVHDALETYMEKNK